jgi:hypothetical protein
LTFNGLNGLISLKIEAFSAENVTLRPDPKLQEDAYAFYMFKYCSNAVEMQTLIKPWGFS